MKIRSVIAACSIGNFLEWYDYTLFGYLASVIGIFFFPDKEDAALMNSLLVFAVGFIMRPLGSIIFGLIGDRVGRRLALVFSILFMTFPTILLGILPTYLQIGVWASILLTILRFVQGIPVGGEVGGILCYLTEIPAPGKKCFYGSFAFVGAQFGFIISSIEIYAFEKWMDPAFFLDWGWRLSFLFGGLLGLLGWYLRNKLHETPDFRYAINHHQVLKHPVATAFKNYKMSFFQAFCFSAFASGGFYVAFYFMSIYFTDILNIPFTESLLVNTLMLIISLVSLPLFGKMGDRFGIKKLIIISTLIVIAVSYFTYYFASQKNLPFAILFQFILVLAMSINFALLPALLSKLFPTPVRYSGVGISYNLSCTLLGGSAPLISLALIQWTGSPMAPAYHLMVLGLITLIPFLFKNSPLKEIE